MFQFAHANFHLFIYDLLDYFVIEDLTQALSILLTILEAREMKFARNVWVKGSKLKKYWIRHFTIQLYTLT